MDNEDIPAEILLVEDNPGDIRLIIELFKDFDMEYNINIALNGEEAMKMLQRKGEYENFLLPDLILLDLNLPKKDGKQVLKEIKNDQDLLYIPVIILTTSDAKEDIIETYNYNANSFITKPVDLDCFVSVIKSIQDFWLNIVKLPSKTPAK
jgi:CheY-like chemotaxis protein